MVLKCETQKLYAQHFALFMNWTTGRVNRQEFEYITNEAILPGFICIKLRKLHRSQYFISLGK